MSWQKEFFSSRFCAFLLFLHAMEARHPSLLTIAMKIPQIARKSTTALTMRQPSNFPFFEKSPLQKRALYSIFAQV